VGFTKEWTEDFLSNAPRILRFYDSARFSTDREGSSVDGKQLDQQKKARKKMQFRDADPFCRKKQRLAKTTFARITQASDVGSIPIARSMFPQNSR
jgi:hypothetical protein